MQYPEPLAQLMASFQRLPGIGNKTASRLAYFVLKMDEEEVDHFAQALKDVKEKLVRCSICGNITENDPCDICTDQTRNEEQLIVVEQPKDVMAMDRLLDYNGRYHVLNGVLSPMEGTGPEDLNLTSLIQRLQNQNIQEVILAMNATPEGEATANYIAQLIKPAGIKVTRIAYGLSVGSDIEYTDEITLSRALKGRREL